MISNYTMNDVTLEGVKLIITDKVLSIITSDVLNSCSYAITNETGKVLSKGEVISKNECLDLTSFKPGFYNLVLMCGLNRKVIPFKL